MSSTLTCFLTIHVVSTHLKSCWLATSIHIGMSYSSVELMATDYRVAASFRSVPYILHIFLTVCARTTVCAKYLHLFLSVCHIFCTFFLQCAQCHIFCTYFLQCAPELCAKYLHLFLSVCHIFCKFFLQCAQCHIFCTYFLQCALELCAIYFAHISYSVRQNYVPYILHIFLAVCARTMCHIFCTYFLECTPELCAIYFAHIS